jgi:hypothetical protein
VSLRRGGRAALRRSVGVCSAEASRAEASGAEGRLERR